MGVLTGSHSVLQIHPTRHCNLSCVHCYSESGPTVTEQLDLEVLIQAVTDAAHLGYTVVSLSGGEPALYPDLVPLLSHAKKCGMRTTMTSNGLPLSTRLLTGLGPVLDVLAISLDGKPQTHDRMRNHPRAFELLSKRLPGIRSSGIPFGFLTTLTRHNVHELAWVVAIAEAQGATFVQVHPLEATGAGATNIPGSVPDDREEVFALFEAARLASTQQVPIQVDITTMADLTTFPEQFHASGNAPSGRLGDWLSPLVIQTDGTVVPLSYGMDVSLALGSLSGAAGTDVRLVDLAAHWDPEPLIRVCEATARRVTEASRPAFDWYGELLRTARMVGRAETAS